MVRLVLSVVAQLIANAVALIVAAALLEEFELSPSGFLMAVVIFTVAEFLLLPLFRQMAFNKARALSGSTALIASFGALVVTTALSDSVEIDKISTWIIATLIVWGASLITTLLLPVFVFKQLRDQRQG
jgi:hypothetical protein